MLKANELRIGNYISYTDHELIKPDRRGKIVTVIPDDIAALHEDPERYEGIVIPVSLTDEWLEKFGFVDDLPWKKERFRFDSEKRFIVVDGEGYGVIATWQVKYVHQLQNIYFCLTGRELQIQR